MKKFSKKIIYYNVFKGFLITIGIFIYCMMSFQPEDELLIDARLIIMSLGVSFIAFSLCSFYGILFYNLSGYEIKETQIICKRGVFFKKKSILDLSKINSVNKKQNILEKFFGVSNLMVDSGSTNSAYQAEILIIENVQVVNQLYTLLKSIDKNNPVLSLDKEEKIDSKTIAEEENLYVFNSKSKVIYTLVNSIGYLLGFLIIASCLFTILFLAYLFPGENDEPLTIGGIVLISILVYIGFVLLSFLGSLVKSFIGYYNYKITRIKDTINVEYGLLVNNHNSFDLSKVKGIVITQGIFQRLFKLATIKVEVIGYVEATNNNAAIGVLIPLCKLSEVTAYLEKIIPTHIPIKQKNKAKAFIPFISWNSIIGLFFTILLIIPAICISLTYNSTLALIISSSVITGIFLLYEIVLVIGALFAYYVQDITFDDENITVHNGSFIKSSTVIKKSNIIAIEDVTTPFRAKKGIYSYIIHFHTNAFSNTKRVNIVDGKYKEMLLESMKY